MPYARNDDLPTSVRDALPDAAQSTWRGIANNALAQYEGDEAKAFATAWAGLRRAGWEKGDDGSWHQVEKAAFRVIKTDEARNLVFGWASVAVRKDGERLVDRQDDMIDAADLEDAAYDFVLESRETGEMHQGQARGRMVESLAVTPEKLEKLGLPADALPLGWWVGFRLDPATFAKVKAGQYRMFSVQGRAVREEVV